jgi:superfamily II DNA or RNA helicase
MGAVKKSPPKAPAKLAGPSRGGDLFIVDNSNEQWTAARYLHDWCEVARAMDVATGYFEIGSLLALDGQWQKLDQIRILMGDEVSKRTKQAFDQAVGQIASKLDDSIEREKETNDFLTGVPAIVDALQNGKITCRVYRERKFHAKAYITHAKLDVIGSTALVGSSNFTYPGLTENIELNVRIRHDVEELQQWYEHYWDEAEDVTPEILRVIERHTREFTPFEVYTKALYEFFQSHEMTANEWERTESRMYPVLDYYQKEGYHALMEIANRYQGALLCDSVGLGKTFIGLMLIERLLRDRKRVALIVPKSGRKLVWETKINRYLPDIYGVYSNLAIYNHTDLLRSGKYPKELEDIKRAADAIIIDEAHHFRNQATGSYRKLYGMLEGKQVFLLTATPINNSTLDLQHQIELFSRKQPDYFRSLGIHTLVGRFRELETALKKLVGGDNIDLSAAEAERILEKDDLFRALVVQRSRAYARRSQEQHGGPQVVFPDRQPPKVATYSLAKTYGGLLQELERAFNKQKPLLSLAIYNPLSYPAQLTLDNVQTSQEFLFKKGRQDQVVGLIRTQLLKRFESSAWAFQATCEGLLFKLLAWAEVHSESAAEKRRLERWKAQHEDLLIRVNAHRNGEAGEEVEDDSSLPVELLEDVEKLSRKEYQVDVILDETYLDMDQLVVFLSDLKDFSAVQDDKLQTLITKLQSDPLLVKHKVLIFSEYRDTARYLYKELRNAGIAPIAQVDSSSSGERGDYITAFAPYYNESSSAKLAEQGMKETRVLVSTDVLSEGLNLQDATLMINYDLHWNPVRLMQRIGRVDRRLDASVEERMMADHPEVKALRGKVHFWNFLPPGELDELLRLYQRVAHKTLRISKLFGIEGKQLLRPDDDYEALKEFNKAYEGQTSPTEEMRLAYRDLLKAHPGLEEKLAGLPKRLFSGRVYPAKGAQAIFFCYRLPGPNVNDVWGLETGATEWYLYDLASGKILKEPEEINKVIRSTPETLRHCELAQETLVEARKKVEAHILNDYLRSRQAPAGVKPVLKAWMELN